MILEELIITEDNINDYINKGYINFIDNILNIKVKVKKLNILYNNIKVLKCSECNIQELNINNLINLKKLYCNSNKLQELNINNLTNLKKLYCNSNKLQELNINNLTNLRKLFCHYNKLQKLNINNLINLEVLFCYKNNNLIIISNNYKYNNSYFIKGSAKVITIEEYKEYLELKDILL